ncbi:MAG: hypothetical protein HUJ69_04660 [Lachnospiraceae bacterium]|nr:hypothetical protein [Lachnospiraceae bacterium]
MDEDEKRLRSAKITVGIAALLCTVATAVPILATEMSLRASQEETAQAYQPYVDCSEEFGFTFADQA